MEELAQSDPAFDRAALDGRPTLGNSGELEGLFRAEFDGLYRYCLARTGTEQAAGDAASMVFVEAARLFAKGRAADVNAGWLYVVARRRIIDQWRAEERHRHRISQLLAVGGRTDTNIEQDDHRTDQVVRALHSLPPRQRAALTLRYIEEHSVSEVAESLDVTYKTAESLLSRARAGFSRAYKEQA